MTDSNTKPEWAQSKREKENAARIAQGLKPRRRLWPWIVIALIIVAVVAFVLTRPAPAELSDTPEVAVVKQLTLSEVTEIAPQLLQQTVKVTGSLTPGQQTQVSSQVGGRVLSVAVRPGDRVAEGDLLLHVDTENLENQLVQQRANVAATRAQLVSSQQQLQRTEELARGGVSSASALEQARSATLALEANVAAQEAQVRSAELALKNATVLSPISGVVSARSVEPGQTVGAGVSLMTIVDLAEVELQGSAPAGSSALIAADQEVTVTVNGLDGRTFPGTVTRVNPVALAGTRTVPVYITLENPGQLLRGGMFATGEIVVREEPEAVAVPAVAVREDAEGFYVLKLEGSELVRLPVETGTSWNRGRIVEITGPVIGDRVVTAPLSQLEPGDTVEMVED
jgi:membrane fusion protein (multidrug efflux system)